VDRHRDIDFQLDRGFRSLDPGYLCRVNPIAQEKYRVVERRVADVPFGKLFAALKNEPYREPELPIDGKALVQVITTAAQADAAVSRDSQQSESMCVLTIFNSKLVKESTYV
jgi:hypothetical protein